ncbi:helix-turn-helix domain-containing protein [Bremerella sp. P1]|uniref:helix-turn-helix domain-containing protein n=1 Tax=Bremerella sp. P1 TaxID=3026424 RepID=UPI00236822CF|nr:helix-turn-helix domain-containing protein [Bremerella sp. P1]WDI41764.1 helix-turn-helix domain-containing protein [Bremerella sp. P1]
MITHTFLEFEAYASAVGDADLRMVLPRIDKPRWEISEFHVDEFHLQYGSEWSGNIAEGVTRPDGKIVFIPLHGRHHANGLPLGEHSVFVMDAASEFTISVQEAHDWCSLFLPDSRAEPNRSSAGRHQGRSQGTYTVELNDQEIANLRWLMTQLHDSIQCNPDILTQKAARDAVKDDLVKVCQRITSVSQEPATTTGRPPLRRDEVIRTLRNLIATHSHECLTIEDFTKALDISERSLRNVFLEYYGMPPRKFLMIQRLNHVRNVLRASHPEETTVTAVAAHFGFWHFGRFAGAYHKIFQEAPSATLNGNCQTC